jgi:hypothetical protein
MNCLRKALALVLVLGLIGILPAGAWAQEQTAPASANILMGKVFMKDGNVPMGGATIRAYHLLTGNVFSGMTSPETGSYLLSALPDGSFEISIQIDEGVYYLEQVLTISGGVRNFMSISTEIGPLAEELQVRLGRQGIDLGTALGMAHLVPEGGDPIATGSSAGRKTAITLGVVGGLGLLYLLLEDDDGSPK